MPRGKSCRDDRPGRRSADQVEPFAQPDRLAFQFAKLALYGFQNAEAENAAHAASVQGQDTLFTWSE
jgi:hypothetical protein